MPRYPPYALKFPIRKSKNHFTYFFVKIFIQYFFTLTQLIQLSKNITYFLKQKPPSRRYSTSKFKVDYTCLFESFIFIFIRGEEYRRNRFISQGFFRLLGSPKLWILPPPRKALFSKPKTTRLGGFWR